MSRTASVCTLAFFSLFSAMAANASGTLADSNGMTLYVFDKDNGSESVCYDDCAKNWPPFLMKDDDKASDKWGMTTRKDGSMQWTYDNHPLYYFIGDKKAGDTLGDGKGGVWHIVTP